MARNGKPMTVINLQNSNNGIIMRNSTRKASKDQIFIRMQENSMNINQKRTKGPSNHIENTTTIIKRTSLKTFTNSEKNNNKNPKDLVGMMEVKNRMVSKILLKQMKFSSDCYSVS